MTLSNGKLRVNQDGFYYLYANICFRHHETSGSVPADYLQLMVYVVKTSIKFPSSHNLMKGGSTKNWSGNSEFHFHSINVGGFFKLRAGEEISVQVSNPSLLDPDQDATYFGAFKVQDIDWDSFLWSTSMGVQDAWKLLRTWMMYIHVCVRLLRDMAHVVQNSRSSLFTCTGHVYVESIGDVRLMVITQWFYNFVMNS